MMPWYDGLTFGEVELAIREGRAPGSNVPGGVIEVPLGYTDWLNAQGSRLREVSGRVIADNRARDQLLMDEVNDWCRRLYDQISGIERARIVEILRAMAEEWSPERECELPVVPTRKRLLLDAANRIEADKPPILSPDEKI